MVSTIRYSANASSDHHPNQVPGILIIMNPKQPNLPTCSVTSTYLLFHLLSNPSLHLIANTTLGIIMTAIKISPKTLNHLLTDSCICLRLHPGYDSSCNLPGTAPDDADAPLHSGRNSSAAALPQRFYPGPSGCQ